MAFVIVLIIGLGLLNLYSSVESSPAKSGLFTAQVQWYVICALAMIAIFAINYHFYDAAAYWTYGIAVLLLILVLLVGKTAKGSSRWIELGFFSFQPSELSKIAFVLCLARYFSQYPKPEGYRLGDLAIPFGLLAVPTVLMLMQPDLGTAMLHVLVFGSICVFVGLRLRTLLGLSFTAIAAAPLMWFFGLKDYQRTRILTLLDPESDPLGSGYHIRQSLIAIGSGRFLGKGYLHGTQTRLQFLPEQHTDFIFSVLSEEWGFLGAAFVLILFFALIVWGVSVAARSKDNFGSILAFGMVSILFWHVFINVGMALGIMPVVGVVMPFFSYGRTAIFTMLVAVTLLLNINSRRSMFE
ncbi:MAG: rod shape-determining protein RodA [Deltaproteobacteria bacterium]|nr:rod shape-determining protein RodA [Deltaproteobacteria bacterium]